MAWECTTANEEAALLREAVDEIERLRALTTWRPIETAPKDNAPRLVYGTWWAEVSEWSDQQPSVGVASSDGGPWYSVHTDCYSVGCDATHWLPMPPPPEADDE